MRLDSTTDSDRVAALPIPCKTDAEEPVRRESNNTVGGREVSKQTKEEWEDEIDKRGCSMLCVE